MRMRVLAAQFGSKIIMQIFLNSLYESETLRWLIRSRRSSHSLNYKKKKVFCWRFEHVRLKLTIELGISIAFEGFVMEILRDLVRKLNKKKTHYDFFCVPKTGGGQLFHCLKKFFLPFLVSSTPVKVNSRFVRIILSFFSLIPRKTN